jgi:hypothetical protein
MPVVSAAARHCHARMKLDLWIAEGDKHLNIPGVERIH